MDNNAVSFSGVVTNLNSNESSNIYFSASTSTFTNCCLWAKQYILS